MKPRLAQVQRWWRQWPEAGIGLRTGNGIFVLDVDPRNGGDVSLEALDSKLPATVQSIMGGGGSHFFFKVDEQVSCKSNALGPGLDIKGDGGYVVLPPSIHASGRGYEWELSSHPDHVAMAYAPDWLQELIPKPQSQAVSEDTATQEVPLGRKALDFVANGAVPGEQWLRAAAASRNYLSAGYSVEDAVQAIWRGLQASQESDPDNPWTIGHAQKLVHDIAGKAPSTPFSSNGHSQMPISATFPQTDSGQAELIASLYSDILRYDWRQGKWLLWTKHYWKMDSDGAVLRLATKAARHRYKEAANIPDLKQREQEAKFSIQAESKGKLESALFPSQAQAPLATTGESWDKKPILLATPKGIIDLASGELRPGKRDDMIMLHSPVNYGPSAQCPRWERFLIEIFDGNEELIDFVWRAVGYSLTGFTYEQCWFLCYGRGENGKSTFLSLVAYILGDYSQTLPFATLSFAERPQIPNDLAALVGIRFAGGIHIRMLCYWTTARSQGEELVWGICRMG